MSAPTEIVLHLTPELAAEVERVRAMTDIPTTEQLFGRAFALLKMAVEATSRRNSIHIVNLRDLADRTKITLPFRVRRPNQEHGE
jgi:hypothetical protein